MAKVIFSSELQRFTGGETSLVVRATNYRELVDEVVARYELLQKEELAKMAVAIDGEIIHDPFLESVSAGSEVHFLFRISGG